ncbi:Putative uncharacterized protein [Lacticaseibacillus paracasei]|nr:Putative uncharacterized protein [Lacticaseibacillus paracasei]
MELSVMRNTLAAMRTKINQFRGSL